MHNLAIVTWIYGALILVGGLMGFVKGKSRISLLMGLIFGAALIACGVYIDQGKHDALVAATTLAAVLFVMFAIRYAKTKKIMPSGMLALISLLATVWLAMGLGRT